MSDDFPTDDSTTSNGPGFPRWLKWGLLGALAILVVVYGSILIYINFVKDSEDPLDQDDLAAALEDDTPAEETPADVSTSVPDTAAPTDVATGTAPLPAVTAPPTTAATGTAPLPATTAPPATAATDGSVWAVTDASELGYRVKEILFGVDTEGVGRTNQITGSLTIEGTAVTEAEFVVDVASITSDESRRDGQFRGRIMSTDEFPTAVFTLTEPIELGTEPAEGVEAATSATGELTLRGVTNPVTFDVTAQLTNGKIGVLGNIPVVFEDYSIANPSIGGITTEDNGLLEFVLVFEPA